MEPLLGGKLAHPPAEIQQVFDAHPIRRSPADWALQWVWNQPEVSLLLSGMSDMTQVEENLRSAETARIGSLNPVDLRLIEQVQERYRNLIPIPCTNCGYCMPCPSGVNIPSNLDVYNDAIVHNAADASRFVYERFIPEKARASACTQCHECDEKCTQGIVISEWMPRVHALLGKAKEG
jgi:hypothetical protein